MSETSVTSLDDTIVAIATPVGSSGIGMVRLSGPDALPILRRLCPGPDEFVPRVLTYGHLVDPETKEVIDEVLAAYMPAPATYTRQDVVEIDCHGGPSPLRRVLDLCLSSGARLAGPGEFTLRAFVNGRIDLAQAEAVADLVDTHRSRATHSRRAAGWSPVGRDTGGATASARGPGVDGGQHRL